MTSHPKFDRGKAAKIEETISSILTTELPDNFVFDPIVVEKRTDHDGGMYFHTCIVFDGDNNELDPSWTLALPEKPWNLSMETGFQVILINPFIVLPDDP